MKKQTKKMNKSLSLPSNEKMKGKKVFVAMSGGVDSSVAALFLKNQGYDITGVFMMNWKNGCGWKEDRRDAMRVCAKLDIPFLTFDFEREYKKEVIEYMVKEYALGNTPNPDVMCNKKIKFGLFFNNAMKMGADYIATGHYARLKRRKFSIHNFQFSNKFKTKNTKPKTIYSLLQAKDKNKDQSYFLWTLTQKQLKHCLFPIGDYLKPEVREMARKAGFITAEKKDSQGLCFVGKVKFKDFLKDLLKKYNKNYSCKKGKILTSDGKRAGEHEGLCFYTIGQRSGIGISGGLIHERKGESLPLYVTDKNIKENILIVAPERSSLLYKKKIAARDLNWINKYNPSGFTAGVRARIRYREPLQKCEIFWESDFQKIKVIFDKPQRAVAPGQSIVFYKKQEMLGGGVICEN